MNTIGFVKFFQVNHSMYPISATILRNLVVHKDNCMKLMSFIQFKKNLMIRVKTV